MVVLYPDFCSADSQYCVTYTSGNQVPHLVASAMSRHPSQYWLASGHTQLSHPASYKSRLQHQHMRTSGFTITPEDPPSLQVVWGPAQLRERGISWHRKDSYYWRQVTKPSYPYSEIYAKDPWADSYWHCEFYFQNIIFEFAKMPTQSSLKVSNHRNTRYGLVVSQHLAPNSRRHDTLFITRLNIYTLRRQLQHSTTATQSIMNPTPGGSWTQCQLSSCIRYILRGV